MKTLKRENGFSAYEQIRELAKLAFKNKGDVSVQASIFGDDYIVTLDFKEVMKGTSEQVRAQLNGMVA